MQHATICPFYTYLVMQHMRHYLVNLVHLRTNVTKSFAVPQILTGKQEQNPKDFFFFFFFKWANPGLFFVYFRISKDFLCAPNEFTVALQSRIGHVKIESMHQNIANAERMFFLFSVHYIEKTKIKKRGRQWQLKKIKPLESY